MMLVQSGDTSINNTESKLKSGRKWKVAQATGLAIEAAKFKKYLVPHKLIGMA